MECSLGTSLLTLMGVNICGNLCASISLACWDRGHQGEVPHSKGAQGTGWAMFEHVGDAQLAGWTVYGMLDGFVFLGDLETKLVPANCILARARLAWWNFSIFQVFHYSTSRKPGVLRVNECDRHGRPKRAGETMVMWNSRTAVLERDTSSMGLV